MLTVTRAIKKPEIYNGKQLWETYHSWGKAASIPRLNEYANAQGMFSSEKGEVSKTGPFVSMWRYAFRNPEEAYPHYEKWAREYETQLIERGVELNFGSFLIDLREHAKTYRLFRPNRIRAWCKKWNINYESN
jgi:hypothetical protein